MHWLSQTDTASKDRAIQYHLCSNKDSNRSRPVRQYRFPLQGNFTLSSHVAFFLPLVNYDAFFLGCWISHNTNAHVNQIKAPAVLHFGNRNRTNVAEGQKSGSRRSMLHNPNKNTNTGTNPQEKFVFQRYVHHFTEVLYFLKPVKRDLILRISLRLRMLTLMC